MNLLQMSFSGGVLILAVVVLRALALHRLPKGTFLALWAVAAARLLLPFSIPFPASVYTLAEKAQTRAAVPAAPLPAAPTVTAGPSVPAALPGGTAAALAVNIGGWVWLAGAAVCGMVFLLSWLRCRRMLRCALPAENPPAQAWLEGRRMRRTVLLRQSDRVDAPLTYGLLHPVILLPEHMEPSRLPCILEHELAHIRCLDALWKPLLALTACLHWFNPLAWTMLVLANRDMELRCDEAVLRRLGLDRRGDYARLLISMEEKKSGLGPFASAFSRNAIEERIRAIMKIKKRSLAAILAAVVLVCCVGVGFATSAARDNIPYPRAEDSSFTQEELDRLASLWFEGYGDMTVAAYQQKMWSEWDSPEDRELIERYSQSNVLGRDWRDEEGTKELNAFRDYFYHVYEPLTAYNWQERTFSDIAVVRTEDGGTAMLEYDSIMRILDPDVLTVGEYERRLSSTKASMDKTLQENISKEQYPSVYQRLSSTTPDGALEVTITCAPLNVSHPTESDAALYAQFSGEVANSWDEILSPYASLGLTWKFDDPDHDGNGLTMWFEGKEVRGIMDEPDGVWITEHTGNSFSDGAVELYAVYTNGVLSGLRPATAEEQAAFDESRASSAAKRAAILSTKEQREFPPATREDYDALLTLRTDGYREMSLEDFNQRLLDWANENTDAWNRICCDVIWGECGVELDGDEWAFVNFTCNFSGEENGMMIRALHTGEPEQDPGLARNLPERYDETNGSHAAWCNLYFDISYHIADKASVTVAERDDSVQRMVSVIYSFWQDTKLDKLLSMTEEDVVELFNAWALVYATDSVRFNPVTGDNIHFEHLDERGIN